MPAIGCITAFTENTGRNFVPIEEQTHDEDHRTDEREDRSGALAHYSPMVRR
jgi:hypothetical protein